MALSLEDVRRVAQLAKIAISDEEAKQYIPQLEAILGYVDRLKQVDTGTASELLEEQMLPPAHDVAHLSSEIREHIIQNFPDRVGDVLRVQAVFSQPKAN
jgi:aspartyl-tRNA(Asn)/glutamyl-tRNA(Gln) amidotransferase subunit C